MNERSNDSLTLRFFVAFWQTLRRWWQGGLLCRLCRWLQEEGRRSVSMRVWLDWGAMPNRAAESCYARFLHKLRAALEHFGLWLEQSLFYRLLMGIQRWWLWLSKRSLLVGFIARLSPRQWLLALFGLYLPLEYLIRDTLHLGFLSSIWEELFIMAGLVVILWRRALKRTPAGALNRETPLDAYLLLFFGVGFLLMNVVCPHPSVALAGYRIVVEYMVWFFLIVRLIENDQDLKVLIAAWSLLTVFLALHGLYQFAIDVEVPSSWTTKTESSLRTRVFSITGSPNILGSLMVLLAPLAAAGLYYFRRAWQKLASFALLGCCLLTLLFTYSRGAWFGMIVTVFFFALLVDRRLIALMGAAMAGILVFVPSITNRITFLFSDAFATASASGGRAMRWALGRMLLKGHEWLGFGLGRYGGAVAMQNQTLDIQGDFTGYFYMDNYYLKTLVEMGYVGLICYLLLLAAMIFCGIRAIQRSDAPFMALPGDPLTRAEGNLRILATALLSGMLGVLAHCFFENIFEEPYMTATFWGMAAVLMYLGFFRQRTVAKPPDVAADNPPRPSI